MPYWSQACPRCGGYIADPLLECVVPKGLPLTTLLQMKPGAALRCPYCAAPIGFDDHATLIAAPEDWVDVKYSRAVLESKKQLDGAPANMSVENWAKMYRFQRPGVHEPLENYPYAP